MKCILSLCLVCWIAGSAWGQMPCNQYDRLIREGKDFQARGEYDKAINKYRSAKACQPARAEQADSLAAEAQYLQKKDLANQNRNPGAGGSTGITPSDRPKKNEETEIRKPVRAPDKKWAWMSDLTKKDSIALMTDRKRLDLFTGEQVDSLRRFFSLLYSALTYDTLYGKYVDAGIPALSAKKFPKDRKTGIEFYSLRVNDYIYHQGWLKAELAARYLPSSYRDKLGPRLVQLFQSYLNHRRGGISDYRMPDTMVRLPDRFLFARRTPDFRNFTWAYSDYDNYNKIEVRYLNLSLPDFVLTTDSLVSLLDTGTFYSTVASTGNYASRITRRINYSLKKSKAEYRYINYPDNEEVFLTDAAGKHLYDLSDRYADGLFMSPDGSHIASWGEGTQLVVLDTKNTKWLTLPDSKPAPTESFSTDCRRVAYYNKITQLIYVADLQGNVLDKIPNRLTGIDSINNIDFTGGDRFLKVNNDDTIALFDLLTHRAVTRCFKGFVDEIVVSPDGSEILLTCNTEYSLSGKSYSGYLGVVTDTAMNIRAKLYSNCDNFFYTPDGVIVGSGDGHIVRFRSGMADSLAIQAGCFGPDEMIEYNCMPLNGWNEMRDAGLLEKGARAYKDQAEAEKDSGLRAFYYKLSATLFHRLASGQAKDIRKERIPFFFDWYNWICRRTGEENYAEQFVGELTAVRIFDRLVESADSVYPQQLFYAANGNMLLANLYDSMHTYNPDVIDQLTKELVLRQRVFDKNPENGDNVYYFIRAFQRYSDVCDTVCWTDLLNGRYEERLRIYRGAERLVGTSLAHLPDSFDLKKKYINILDQLSASWLYVAAPRPGAHLQALDSARYFADKALAMQPGSYDSARLLMVKARAWLLTPGGVQNALGLYRRVRAGFKEFSTQSMSYQLDLLRQAGAKETEAMKTVRNWLKEEK